MILATINVHLRPTRRANVRAKGDEEGLWAAAWPWHQDREVSYNGANPQNHGLYWKIPRK